MELGKIKMLNSNKYECLHELVGSIYFCWMIFFLSQVLWKAKAILCVGKYDIKKLPKLFII
jgi:hypothetical protein